MTSVGIYIDTSALAKRYVAEVGSTEFDDFLAAEEAEFVVSPLVATELESILQRLMREARISAAYAEQARELFAIDLASALWSMRPFGASVFAHAAQSMRELALPLATLDALHLACAIELRCEALASGDRRLLAAAAARGLRVHSFVV